jgi:cyclase
VLAASVLHDGTLTIAQAKAAMAARGIPVRPVQPWPPRLSSSETKSA